MLDLREQTHLRELLSLLGLRLRQRLAHLLHVVIQPRAMRRTPTKNRRARWIARGRRAVGIREQHPALRQPVKVRRLGLRMPAETADPVIQIVHSDEEDVRLRRK